VPACGGSNGGRRAHARELRQRGFYSRGPRGSEDDSLLSIIAHLHEVRRPSACVRGRLTDSAVSVRVRTAWRSAPQSRSRLGAHARGGRQPSSHTDLKDGRSTAADSGSAAVTHGVARACDIASSAFSTLSMRWAPICLHNSQKVTCKLQN
jgi:hypothetical protein